MTRRTPLAVAAAALLALAACAPGSGSSDDAASELRLAVEHFESGPRPLALALACEDLGTAELRAGNRESGVEALGRSLELYSRVGAARDESRARGRLRELGVRRRLVSARRPEKGWEALTDSELKVVDLVAEGMTNRQVAAELYLSPHTVSTHLRHAFAKLGVNSRVELARVALEQRATSSES